MPTYTLTPAFLVSIGVVADGNLLTGAGTNNATALNAWLASVNGTLGSPNIIIVPATTVIAAETIRLPQTPHLEILCANAVDCGFVRKSWDGTSDRQPWVTNQPNNTTHSAGSTRNAAHLVISKGVWNANSTGNIPSGGDQHSNLTYGWNVGFLFVALTFDATSQFRNALWQNSRTFMFWLMNCARVVTAAFLFSGVEIAGAAQINSDGIHLNHCDGITGQNLYIHDTADDAIAFNVESLSADWSNVSTGDAITAPKFYGPTWVANYNASDAGVMNCHFDTVRIKDCTSAIRFLPLRGIPVSNCRLTNSSIENVVTPFIVSPFGTNPGSLFLDNLEVSNLLITPKVGSTSFIMLSQATHRGFTKLNNWTMLPNGAADTALGTVYLEAAVETLETKNYTSIRPATEDTQRVHWGAANVQSWDISGAKCIRLGAAKSEAITLFWYNTSAGLVTLTANGYHVEGYAAIFVQGNNERGTLTNFVSSGGQFVAPGILNPFRIPVPTTSGAATLLAASGTEPSTVLFDDLFDGATFNAGWSGTSGAPSGGDFKPADNLIMVRNTGAAHAIVVMEAQVSSADAGSALMANSTVNLIAAANAAGTVGYIAATNAGSAQYVNGGKLSIQQDSALSGTFYGSAFPRTPPIHDAPFRLGYVQGATTGFAFADVAATGAGSALLGFGLGFDYRLNTYAGIVAGTSNGGVKVRRFTAYSNVFALPSAVTLAAIAGVSAAQYGVSPAPFTATVTGTGRGTGYQTGIWSIQSGTGTINAFTGQYTPPTEGVDGAQTIIRFSPLVNTVQNVTKTVTLSAAVAPATPTVTSVTVTPAAPTVQPLATLQFAAAVVVTNAASQTVTWSKVSGVGTISGTGLYTAPAGIVGTAQTAVIRATSTFDVTKLSDATVTIPALPAPAPAAGAAIYHVIMAGDFPQTATITPYRLTAGDTAGGIGLALTDDSGGAILFTGAETVTFNLRAVGTGVSVIDDAPAAFFAQERSGVRLVRFSFSASVPVPPTGNYEATFVVGGVTYPLGRKQPVRIQEQI